VGAMESRAHGTGMVFFQKEEGIVLLHGNKNKQHVLKLYIQSRMYIDAI
jgi:hypothetical protein